MQEELVATDTSFIELLASIHERPHSTALEQNVMLIAHGVVIRASQMP